VIGPHLAKAQDWPGADEIGDELAALAPGGAQNNPLQQQVQQMGQELQQANQKIASMEQDRAIEAQKLQIEQFNAETNRMKAVRELEPAAPDAPDTSLPEADRIILEGQIKERLEAMKIEGNLQLELLRQQGAPEDPKKQQEQAAGQSAMESILAQVGQLQRLLMAPRKRTLVRGPDGRAVEAMDEIVMPEEPAPEPEMMPAQQEQGDANA
jgi:hypothetical protein